MDRMLEQWHSRGLSTVVLLIAYSCICSGESIPDVGELVGHYREALRWNQRVSMCIDTKIDSESTNKDDPIYHQEKSLIYRRDRERVEWIGNLSDFEDQEHKVLLFSEQYVIISNGQDLVGANKRIGEDYVYTGSIWRKDYKKALRSTVLDYYNGGFIYGITGGLGEAQNLAEFFSQNDTVRIIGKENIDEVSCYIVEAKTKSGTITVWIAPQKGYNTMRISHKANNEKWSKLIDSIEVQKTDGIFIPVSGRFTLTNRLEDGSEDIVRVHVRCSQIDLNPDFDALGAFELYSFPDGSRIYDKDFPGIRYKVSGGELVPDVDEAVIEELDNTAKQLLAEGTVPSGLGTVDVIKQSNNEPNNILNTQTDNAESQTSVLSESHGFPLIILIPLGLLIIGIIGWTVFSKSKLKDK